MKIKASNDKVWVLRKEVEKEKGGIAIPGSAQKKPHKGDILTVGKLVSDDTIKEGKVAIFNKSSGTEIEEAGIVYTVLSQIDILGTE
jgi:chaperonin GroES